VDLYFVERFLDVTEIESCGGVCGGDGVVVVNGVV